MFSDSFCNNSIAFDRATDGLEYQTGQTYYSAEATLGPENAPKYTLRDLNMKIFLGRGKCPLPRPNGEGGVEGGVPFPILLYTMRCPYILSRRLYSCACGTRLGPLQNQILDLALLLMRGWNRVTDWLRPVLLSAALSLPT